MMADDGWGRAALPAALTAAAWMSVGQAELPIEQFQQAGTKSYGVTALGGGLMPHWGNAHQAVVLWSGQDDASKDQAWTFLIGYTLVDLGLIVCLVWLLSVVARAIARRYDDAASVQERVTVRRGIYDWNRHPLLAHDDRNLVRRLRPLAYYAIFDVAEDVIRLTTFAADGNKWLYVVGYVAEKAKFVALVAVILAMVAGYGKRRQMTKETRSAATNSLRVLRGQVGLVIVLGALLMVDVTGQVGDFFRRWSNPVDALVGVLAVLVFALVLWASGRRIAIPSQTVPGFANTSLKTTKALAVTFAVALVVGAGLAWWFRTAVPLSLATALFCVLLLELFRRFDVRPVREIARADLDAKRAARGAALEAEGPRLQSLQGLGRFLAMVPIALVGIALVKAGTGPLILSFESTGYRFWSAAWLLAVGVLLILAACWLIPPILAGVDGAVPAGLGLPYLAVSAAVAALVVVQWMSPIEVPEWAGSLAVVLVALSALGLVFAELQRLAEITPAPQGLSLIGFKRTPVFLILAAWFAVASVYDVSGHHDIRTRSGNPQAVALNDVWSAWLKENCAGTAPAVADAGDPVGGNGTVPMVFVIAEGGGIRAAYWTGSVLTSLLSTPDTVAGCPAATGRSRIFAISSISGGSLGAAAYLSQRDPDPDWYKAALGDPDYSAVALSRGLVVDLPRALLGYNSDDRAGLLERAWEKNLPELGDDYFTALRPGVGDDGTWMPITMLNGAQAETGCRINTSDVRLATTDLDEVVDCRATVGVKRTINVAPPGTSPVFVPAAPLTVDALAVARKCPVSFSISTAALMSARWPYISPSGRIPCGDTSVSSIDGGYADPAGYQAFLELWNQLSPLVAQHNAHVVSVDSDNDGTPDTYPGLVVPVLVVVDNHYQSVAQATDPGRTPESLVPPLGFQRAGKARGPDREQEATSEVAGSPPGSSATCSVPPYRDSRSDDGSVGRVVLAPKTQPGLPAPLAWTLAQSSRDDLDSQRDALFDDGDVGAQLRQLMSGEDSLIQCQG